MFKQRKINSESNSRLIGGWGGTFSDSAKEIFFAGVGAASKNIKHHYKLAVLQVVVGTSLALSVCVKLVIL